MQRHCHHAGGRRPFQRAHSREQCGQPEKIPLGYEKSTSGLPTQKRVPHGYLTSKNVVYATRGVTTVVSATYGFTDLPHRYLTPSSTTSPLPDPFIYHSPTNTFFRYIMGSKVVQIVLVPFDANRERAGMRAGKERRGGGSKGSSVRKRRQMLSNRLRRLLGHSMGLVQH